jgi:tRNA modification GTPase
MHTGKTWNDTIVALATPPGVGALGVLRLSGKQAIDIANKLFVKKELHSARSHTLHVGWLVHEDKMLDEAVLSLYKAPRSYTGEDVIELSCHGSPYVLQQVLDACISLGARLARPGEFTQRAFLNGKLDLAQAEAVADVIASQSAAAHKASLHQMRGGFSNVLKELREQLIKFSALIELELDFATEDVEFADRTAFYHLIDKIDITVNGLLQSFALGNVIKQGIQVAIIGKPNAGKSTLLNALLNENRAIVSDIAGTTRDTIEEVLNIDGLLFRLIDTAGIRVHTSDLIESMGMEKSVQKMKQADLVICLVDVNNETKATLEILKAQMEAEDKPYMLVGNKCDLQQEAHVYEYFQSLDVLLISAKAGLHIQTLKERMVEAVLRGRTISEDTIVTNARHYGNLQQVAQSLAEIRAGLANQLPGDLLALDIRRCLHYLGEITGAITNEDQLDYIFSKFCIGK